MRKWYTYQEVVKRLSSKELVILPFSWLLVKCCDGSQAFLALLWQILSRSSPYPHLKSAINFFSFSIWTLYIYIYISDLFIAITISAHGNRVDESTKHYEKWIHIFERGKNHIIYFYNCEIIGRWTLFSFVAATFWAKRVSLRIFFIPLDYNLKSRVGTRPNCFNYNFPGNEDN